MTIAVDFDGTIVEHRYPGIGREKPMAIDTLIRLADDGHKLILWTAREGQLLDDALRFCRERGLSFYAVNSERPDDTWERSDVARKIVADMYIDDRNLGGLPDWEDIYRMVKEHISFADMPEYSRRMDRTKRKKKKSFLKRLSERCRDARSKYDR
ncbi:MAG: hypothetical protein MJY65_02965 [Bacteroidaceae bacterium]|nr:hypothetical protein [Bacteroidaceae bacterium]